MKRYHWKIDKYSHTKEHKDLSWETLMGKKTQQNFLCIRCIKSTRQDPRQVLLPVDISLSLSLSLSLSPMRYTQVSECSNEEHNSSIYILSATWLLN